MRGDYIVDGEMGGRRNDYLGNDTTGRRGIFGGCRGLLHHANFDIGL